MVEFELNKQSKSPKEEGSGVCVDVMILCDLIVYFFISGESSPFFPHQQSPDAGGGGDEGMMVVGEEGGQASSYFAADDLFSSLLAAAETLRRNEEALLKSSGAVENSVENGILFPPAVKVRRTAEFRNLTFFCAINYSNLIYIYFDWSGIKIGEKQQISNY
jgi:hypothetical protein